MKGAGGKQLSEHLLRVLARAVFGIFQANLYSSHPQNPFLIFLFFVRAKICFFRPGGSFGQPANGSDALQVTYES